MIFGIPVALPSGNVRSDMILATSLLIGSKAAQEPVARIMLNNLLCLP